MSKEVSIRKLRISDIYALHKMYDSLSEESKRYFHPGFLGFQSINLGWFLAQFAIAASSAGAFKKLLVRIYPLAAFFMIVSTDKQGKIIGFGFIKCKSCSTNQGSIGELGICILDGYQGNRIGSELMNCLLSISERESFRRIFLTVMADNPKAVSLYEKFGFGKVRLVRWGDVWAGKRFDCYEMSLNLPRIVRS